MAGRIRDEDIAAVREKARIDDVVSSYLTLRNAGGGSQKGLCPFHDEKSPSFHVNPSRGFYHCLAGETRVLTWDGPREIRDLAGGTHRILNRHGDWVEAPFKSYGVQPLLKITITRNRQRKELFATDEHRWFVRSGAGRASSKELLTKDLHAGQRLVAKFPRSRIMRTTPSPFGIAEKKFARRGWVVESVEPTDRVEEVFCAEVEDGHAFTLEDNILTGNCFGCGEGGDVISFLMKIDGLSFTEAVERLADKTGIELRREEGDASDRPKGPPRRRLLEAHAAAQEFYAEQLRTPDALAARQFLDQRGFDQAAALTFGVGFAPREGRALNQHLRSRGFGVEEMTVGGLVGASGFDKFRGRLLWPIREASGETIGFGARRIFDDDRIEAKYLNTAETPIYKKSHVLYGIDLARREMARTSQVVVVEGYTDVMACHIAGVGTAVATCGTAFGEDHTRIVRRFIDDHDESRGEVIFTFDGDSAGQKAALKAFQGDQRFVAQTYIAVAPDGQDPCELRINAGDEAVRALVAGRRPLYRFALEAAVGRYDLDRADGRVDALRAGAQLVASVRDRAKVDAFARELASLVGVDPDQARAEVRRAASRPKTAPADRRTPAAVAGAGEQSDERPAAPPLPHLRDPRFAIERETLKVVLQHPVAIGRTTSQISPDDFLHPTYRAVWELVAAAGGPAAGDGDTGWAGRIRDAATDPGVATAISALAVEPLPTAKEADAAYVASHVFRLLEVSTQRRIDEVRSRLLRADPAGAESAALFAELASLEQSRRTLRDRIVGAL